VLKTEQRLLGRRGTTLKGEGKRESQQVKCNPFSQQVQCNSEEEASKEKAQHREDMPPTIQVALKEAQEPNMKHKGKSRENSLHHIRNRLEPPLLDNSMVCLPARHQPSKR